MLARLAAIAIAAATIAPAAAQEPVEPYEIKRLIIGKQLLVDEAFAEANGTPEPTPFRITVPTGEDFLTIVDSKKGGFMKVTFATPDREFLESIHFVDMEIPANLGEDRTAVTAKLMSEQVFAAVTEGRKDPKVLTIRETEIGGLGAVEVIGRYTDAEHGLIYLWIVGLPHPVQARGTYAIANIHFARRPMETDEEFPRTLAGRTLYSFAYTE